MQNLHLVTQTHPTLLESLDIKIASVIDGIPSKLVKAASGIYSLYVCMYVCKIYLTSVKNVVITKSSIYNTNLDRPRQILFVTS